MNYHEWEKQVPEAITEDAVWRLQVYRLALFLADVAWRDVSQLVGVPQMRSLADQLYRSVGSVSANISEGYSRTSKKDQLRFYEYALGSAREARGWYFKSRHVLGADVAEHRLLLHARVIQLLLRMMSNMRGSHVREEPAQYNVTHMVDLLEHVPLSQTPP